MKASVMCLVAVLLWAVAPGDAANPTSGTISATNTTLTYTAGPFLVSNPSAQAGAPVCNAQLQCDEFALTVNVPASYADTHSIRVTTTFQTPPDTDYDLYIRRSDGTQVASAASSSNPEVALFDAISGNYVVRNIPFTVAGGSISVLVELIEKPANPPPPPPGSGPVPRYEVYQAPAGLGDNAGEPTLGVGKAISGQPGGRTMFIAGLETLRVTFDDCSSPAKALWEDVSAPTTSINTLDPILQTDFETGRTFVSQLAVKSSLLAFTDNDGGINGQAPGDWTPSQGSGINSGVDHQTVGVGAFIPGLPDGVGYANAVYYASQDIAVAEMSLSRDGGLTFGPSVPMYNLTQCSGIHGHIQVTPDGPQKGTVYVPNRSCGGKQGVAVSTDEGLTFSIRTVPNSTSGDTDAAAGVDKAGRVYFGYQNGDSRARIAVSDDRGLTWINDQDVGAQLGIKNALFPSVVAGDAGRAAFTFIGTTTAGDYNVATFPGVWYVYVAHTYDGGATWQLVNATPNNPVQRGDICTSGTTCATGGLHRNLLDFYDIQVDHQGRVLVGFADGCVNCTSRAASTGEKATIARQSGGKRLFAAFDTPEPTAPKAPRVNGATADALGVVTVSWQEPDNGGSALTGYNVSRKTGAGGTYAVIANVPANRNSYMDSTAVQGTQYFYKVTAVNAIGESAFCGEFPVGIAAPIESPCITPGVTIATDPAGDNTTGAGVPSHDIRLLSVAEVYNPALAANKLFFRLKVANGSPLAPESRWSITFTRTVGTPTPTNWFITMLTEAPAGTPTAPVFRYGHVEVGAGGTNTNVTDGTLDASSTFLPDGSILLHVSTPTKTGTAANNLAFPALQTGETLSNVKAEVRQKAGVLLALIDDTSAANYTLVGNNFCRPNTAPTAALTANPVNGDAPLNVNFDASGSSDPDTTAPADTIASYTFNFGDGSPEVTQSGPLVSHTYSAVGNFPARVRVTDSRGKASTNAAQATITVNAAAAGLQYYPLSRPLRLLDTRAGQPACDTPGTPLAAGQSRLTPARVTCDGITIPANAQVLVGNATVDNTAAGSSDGFITLYPGGSARPTVSNLNYVAGQAVPNAFTVGLGGSGAFNIYAFSTTNMVIDVTGYYAPPTPTGLYYHPLSRPLRLLDTRGGQPACDAPGQTLAAGQSRSEQARVTCDGLTIPTSAQAIVGNATVVNDTGGSAPPGGVSFVTLYPTGVARPNASNLNYVAGQVVPNAFTVSLGTDGAFNIYATESINFVVDVAGYYSTEPTDANGTGLFYFSLVSPLRLFDTRAGQPACEAPGMPLVGGVDRSVMARLTCSEVTIPSNALAIVGNATVVNDTPSNTGGFVTLYPNGVTRPTASNLNYVSNQVVPNSFTVGLGATGAFNIYATSNINFIVDVAGFFAP